MQKLLDGAIACLIPCLVLFYMSVAPYTHGGENFAVQTTHDLFSYGGLGHGRWTHRQVYQEHGHPQDTPSQSFVSPLLLACLASPFQWLVLGLNRQLLVRAILGLVGSFAVLAYRNAVLRAWGRETANWYIILQAVQFYPLYWISRTEPIFIAFGLSTFALRLYLPRATTGHKPDDSSAAEVAEARGFAALSFLAVTLQYELAALLASHALFLLITKQQTFEPVFRHCSYGVLCALLITVPLDTVMWQSRIPVWPALHSFLADMHRYSASETTSRCIDVIPSALFLPIVQQTLIPHALATPELRRSSAPILIPNLLYICICIFVLPSRSPHMLALTSPALTAVAARSAAWLWRRGSLSLLPAAIVLIGATTSVCMLILAPLTYPGATALNSLHALADGTQASAHVYLDAAACSSGAASPFLQLSARSPHGRKHTRWSYEAAAQTGADPQSWAAFDYALVAEPAHAAGAWEIVRAVKGLAGVQVLRPGQSAKPASDYPDLPPWPLGDSPWEALARRSRAPWASVEIALRARVTRGWWVAARVEPRIYILRKTKGVGGSVS